MIDQDTDTPDTTTEPAIERVHRYVEQADRLAALKAQVTARSRRRGEAKLAAAKLPELGPACALATEALPRFAEFDSTYGAFIREMVSTLQDPDLEQLPRCQALLWEARRQGEELLAVLTTCPAGIRKTLAEVEALTPADVQGEFRPIANLTDRLTKPPQSVERLPDLLARFAGASAKALALAEKQTELLPKSTAPTFPDAPPDGPRFAKSSLSRGAGV